MDSISQYSLLISILTIVLTVITSFSVGIRVYTRICEFNYSIAHELVIVTAAVSAIFLPEYHKSGRTRLVSLASHSNIFLCV